MLLVEAAAGFLAKMPNSSNLSKTLIVSRREMTPNNAYYKQKQQKQSPIDLSAPTSMCLRKQLMVINGEGSEDGQSHARHPDRESGPQHLCGRVR